MSRLLLLLTALFVVAACGQTPATLSSADQEDLLQGLCEAFAGTDNADGDVAAAEAAFFNRAHAPLHTLADELTDAGSVSTAADLLVAKQRVEASFGQQLPTAMLHDNLATVMDATDRGLDALGLPRLECAEPSE